MPGRSVWLRILGVEDSVLENLVEEPDGSVVAHVRPKRRQRQRCGIGRTTQRLASTDQVRRFLAAALILVALLLVANWCGQP